MSIDDELQPMLTLNDVVNLLHVHPNTVRRWANAGILKAYQINSRGDRRFLKKDIKLLLETMNHNHIDFVSDALG